MNLDAKEFEEKLRIQKKVEKEFRDRELSEWVDAIVKGSLLLIIFSVLFKACVN